jgi:hypothetical protein
MDLFPVSQLSDLGTIASRQTLKRDNADNEFVKIFYKELLRQVFTSSDSAVNQDILIDKLAEEMARKNMAIIK